MQDGAHDVVFCGQRWDGLFAQVLSKFLIALVTDRVVGEGGFEVFGDADVVHDQSAGLSRKVRLTRAMACIRVAPRIGLSTYMVCIEGESKPVSHMSRTITISSGSSGSLARDFSAQRLLGGMCGCNAAASAAEPVITTFIRPCVGVVGVPVGAQRGDLVVKGGSDAARHRDDHGLARQLLAALLPVRHDVRG